MFYIAPETVVTVAPFRDETMNVRVPLKISAKGMKNHNEPRSKVFDLFILKNIRETTPVTAWNRQLRSSRSSRKK